MRSEDLLALLDFIYLGETNIFQENLDSFLALAEELKLKGLAGGNDQTEMDESDQDRPSNNPSNNCDIKPWSPKSRDNKNKTFKEELPKKEYYENYSGDLRDLNEKVRSMFNSTRRDGQGVYVCQVCGKESKYPTNIRDHIEAHHVEGISLACNLCEKSFRSRSSLRLHKHIHIR